MRVAVEEAQLDHDEAPRGRKIPSPVSQLEPNGSEVNIGAREGIRRPEVPIGHHFTVAYIDRDPSDAVPSPVDMERSV